MKIAIRHQCAEAHSFRAAAVKSLFNADAVASERFDLDVDLPIDGSDWRLGVVVGPSGSGKTSIGRAIWGDDALYQPQGWRPDRPIVDDIAPDASLDDVTAALAAVGLGTVPAWLRPYHVLSNGERFRADLARLICAAPARVVIDEFTSVVDRQIARVGALAFAKSWRRTGGQAVLLSCHYDILDWVEADWVFDTRSGRFLAGRQHWRRPPINLQVEQTDGHAWPLFEPHHYLKLPRMVAARYFIGMVEGEPVAHVAVSPKLEVAGVRACRLVIMPEWQGAGIGLRFLNAVCEHELAGLGRYGDRVRRVFFHTSHPGLNLALARSGRWQRVSANLFGSEKAKSRESIERTTRSTVMKAHSGGWGGHFRAVTGWRLDQEGNR
ncbi:MAG: ABC transporter ATP-binding protein [Alphaproteobacteria bacterium]|nr:ABC transporter ATP-binding protein [Alphaproteobacteria bacterium]